MPDCSDETCSPCPDAVPSSGSSQQEVILKRKLKASRNRLYRKKKSQDKTAKKKPSIEERKTAVLKELSALSLPQCSVDFIESQLRVVDKKKKAVRWTEKDKTTALSIYHASPKAYRILKTIFCLPSVRTMRRAVQGIQIFPGFSENILQALSLKVHSLPANHALCALIFDELSIKEMVSYDKERDRVEGLEDFGDHGRSAHAANHATVFMVRGLLTNWKQPVGYFLSSGTIKGELLHDLILDCISKAEEAGLVVKVVIADQGANNRKAFTSLGITTESPFFLHNGKKIHVMYDPPHLLKNIRNNMKKTGFVVSGESVSWQHVDDFFRFDKRNGVRLAPRLTERHISLPPFTGLRVRYAAQVLSHSVAKGMSLLVQLKVFSEEIKPTADFAENFDQLFNAFNSGSIKSSHAMRHAVSESSGHSEFLREKLAWLETVQSCSAHSLPCLAGWKMAIRTLLALWDDLHQNHDVKFLLTDRLNQDCLENLFSQVRGNAGRIDNPSAGQLRTILRQIMVDQIFVHSKGSNCEEDSSKFLLRLSALKRARQVQPQFAPEDNAEDYTDLLLIATPLPPPKDQYLQAAEDNVLTYIAGYIASKLLLKVCEMCKCMLTGPLTGSQNQLLIVHKQYEHLKDRGLEIPSSQLVMAVQQLEKAYIRNVDRLLPGNHVKAQLLHILKKTVCECELSCPLTQCELEKLVIDRYINVRLHFSLKNSNESFRQKSVKRNRKVMQMSHQ